MSASNDPRGTRRYARRVARVVPGAGHPAEGVISFGSGDAYPESLPDVAELAQRAATKYRTETLQYAPRPGLPELREWIAGHVARDGIRVGADSILVCNGAKQGIELACKLFLDPGDAIVVTRPTYQSALGVFHGWEAAFVEVGMDDDGMRVDELATILADRARQGLPAPKLVYDVPEFHNPSGVTMSRARREALVELAMRHGMVILEDDPYRRIRFSGEPVPPIQSFDRQGCVIGLGTFAKLVAPGLRLGWVIAPPDVVHQMAAMKADGGTTALTQRILVEYCRAGRLEPDIVDRVRTYRAHRDVMAQAVREQLPHATFRLPDGGYYLWLRLPEAVDGDRLAALAEAEGVQVLPSSHFHATPGPKNFVRLAYSYASPSEIVEGVRRLARAYRAMGA
ncbi:MAG: PLP-dependent aminotransferase family protein [Candidatus Rokubacteria bacterium]|nr:PLP-dependent aminotransferase family protein [Candidatus Rokubacteria bacterium]